MRIISLTSYGRKPWHTPLILKIDHPHAQSKISKPPMRFFGKQSQMSIIYKNSDKNAGYYNKTENGQNLILNQDNLFLWELQQVPRVTGTIMLLRRKSLHQEMSYSLLTSRNQ